MLFSLAPEVGKMGGIVTDTLKKLPEGPLKELFGLSERPASPLDKFVATVRKSGVARTNRYEFVIPVLPSSMGKMPADIQDKLMMYAEKVDLPTFNLQTDGVSYGTGPIRKIPYTLNEGGVGDIKVDFIVDANLDVLSFFDIWLMSIYDNYKHEVGFFKHISTNIEIYHIEPQTERRTRGYRFTDVVPKQFSPPSYSYKNDNTYMTLPVTFEYHNYELIIPEVTVGEKAKEMSWWMSTILANLPPSLRGVAGSGLTSLGKAISEGTSGFTQKITGITDSFKSSDLAKKASSGLSNVVGDFKSIGSNTGTSDGANSAFSNFQNITGN